MERVEDILEEIEEDYPGVDCFDQHVNELGKRIRAAYERECNDIERAVRDAIIGYVESYPHAPNDDCERELKERAERANAWLEEHGFMKEGYVMDKEEIPWL